MKSLQKVYVPPLSAQSESRLGPKERVLWFSEILDGASWVDSASFLTINSGQVYHPIVLEHFRLLQEILHTLCGL